MCWRLGTGHVALRGGRGSAGVLALRPEAGANAASDGRGLEYSRTSRGMLLRILRLQRRGFLHLAQIPHTPMMAVRCRLRS